MFVQELYLNVSLKGGHESVDWI